MRGAVPLLTDERGRGGRAAFVVALAVAAGLVASALPAVAAGPEERPSPPTTTHAKANETHGKPSSLGDFSLSSHAVTGQFVAFTWSETSVTGFAVHGVHVFDITVSGTTISGGSTGADAHGAELRVRTPSYELHSHDNPEAVTRVDTNGTITLVLVPDATLTPSGEHGRANFTLGNLTGTLRGGSLAIAGHTVTAQGELLVFVDRPHGDFDVHRGEIGEAIGKGHVGAEASFNQVGDDVEQDVVAYGNVTMQKVKAERGNITLLVSGHGTEGRVLVLNIDGRVLGAERADDLVVLLDNKTVAPEADLAALLDPDADGIEPVYHVVFDPSAHAFQLLVRVPHYSVHTLSVTTLPALVTPSVVIGIVAGVALLVPSAMLLFRRKRGE